MKKTIVIFMYNEGNKDLFAFFPYEPDFDSKWNKMCYSHLGQHSACSIDYFNKSRKATKEEFTPLFLELKNLVGYNLKVIN